MHDSVHFTTTVWSAAMQAKVRLMEDVNQVKFSPMKSPNPLQLVISGRQNSIATVRSILFAAENLGEKQLAGCKPRIFLVTIVFRISEIPVRPWVTMTSTTVRKRNARVPNRTPSWLLLTPCSTQVKLNLKYAEHHVSYDFTRIWQIFLSDRVQTVSWNRSKN